MTPRSACAPPGRSRDASDSRCGASASKSSKPRNSPTSRSCSASLTNTAPTARWSPSTTLAPATQACRTSENCGPTSSRSTATSSPASPTTPARQRLVGAMVDYAHELGIRVVTEGIETQGDLEATRALNADLGQGWHVGRPSAQPAPAPTRSILMEAGRLNRLIGGYPNGIPGGPGCRPGRAGGRLSRRNAQPSQSAATP